MLRQIEIRSGAPLAQLAGVTMDLGGVFPDLVVRACRAPAARAAGTISHQGEVVVVPLSRWEAADLDPTALDDVVAETITETGTFALRIVDSGQGALLREATQVITRCQRHLSGRNAHSATPFFDAVLAHHRTLHDLGKPLVAADYDHARDTWRWILRLAPDASAALQMAALFHDVERLVSESERRIEQHAADYQAFKDAHAAAGARLTAAALVGLGAPPHLVARVADLVATHERPAGDEEKALLNEADALSFFSLNAPGFARYYGPVHTARKVAYTLARLTPRGRQALGEIRHRADIARIIEACGDGGEESA
jgi:hypothetical protein